jgi:hypothetical protein
MMKTKEGQIAREKGDGPNLFFYTEKGHEGF